MNSTKKTIIIVTIFIVLIAAALLFYITDLVLDNSTMVRENKIEKNINNINTSLNKVGKNIYNKYCIACHGASGQGDGPEAYKLNTKPTDFTSGNIKFKTTPYGTKPTIDDIISTLKLGVRTTSMLPQLQLSGKQMNAVASYVISLIPKDKKRGKPIEISKAPSMNDALLKEGKKLFEINCVSCHGKEAKGNGLLSKSLVDYKQNPIHPADLTLRPLKRTNTPQWMYMIISTGIEGTPMPSFQNVFKPSERWAIVDYVESLKSGYRSSSNNGMMGGMMNSRFIGEEFKGMQIDMAAGHAWMMGMRKK